MNPNQSFTGSDPTSPDVKHQNLNGLGSVTREMCQLRARELAVIASRPLRQVWQADYLQAKRELTGETDPELQDAILDSVPPAGK